MGSRSVWFMQYLQWDGNEQAYCGSDEKIPLSKQGKNSRSSISQRYSKVEGISTLTL